MAASNFKLLLSLFILSISISSTTSNNNDGFLQCFFSKVHHSNPIDNVIFTKNSSFYTSLLQSSIRNLRFSSSTSAPKPEFIITPYHESHVQATVICGTKNSMQVRVRSGGHDYEGLSYVADVPFIIIDLVNLRSITVDIDSESAWVEAGAILGELYYKIAEKSSVHGFPAGSCPTVGVGGHISGGGFGTIFRKYGLAADNILDAKLVNVNGKVLDRVSMGEDLFWAIRGGGGLSFGVILSWRIRLVPVPPSVTVFNIGKTLEQGAGELLQKWQTVGSELHEDLFLHAVIEVAKTSSNGENKTIKISFFSLFLGPAEKLVPLMQESLPGLGLELSNCTEMSWIESVLYFAGFSIKEPMDILLNRTENFSGYFKAKSDYVKEPISESGLEGVWKTLLEDETSLLILTPYGGKMSEIGDSETPFPHRCGNLYKIQYLSSWYAENETEEHIGWMRRLYDYMEPHVSKSPRAAYFNYRDLDLGTNIDTNSTGYEQASKWGLKYFKHNFKRLVAVKTRVDPHNFFRNEQSIPSLPS
ncbi:tetrahydroberberine oxidase-like [Ziziphus jujuba]|uniref:Tetrahydroberberine oxidase-like n=1 Tax=Ziziphus jujuba TaxID=326968 RepID=A0ABM3I824_ZIZJJ|nr:tetrahydroberberine oxidase-like [Ziziphus jujuba]